MKLGFIGLGRMGSGVAANLMKGGHELLAWNRSPEPLETLADAGAQRAGSPAEAFGADVVFSMLSDDAAVEAAILHSGALEGARPGCVHVNLATISVALAERLEAAHGAAGLGYVAAPVLGRPDAAAEAQLNVLCAGAPAAVARVRPLLDLIGRAVWPIGEAARQANAVKLAINFALASMIETLGEAGTLAKAYGVEPAALYEVMTGTLFAASAYKGYAAMIAEQRFEPAGFALLLGLKDVRLALAAGEAAHAPLPIASVLRDAFLEAVAMGDGGKDWSALAAGAFRRAGRSLDRG